jgi:hypothetical protein
MLYLAAKGSTRAIRFQLSVPHRDFLIETIIEKSGFEDVAHAYARIETYHEALTTN